MSTKSTGTQNNHEDKRKAFLGEFGGPQKWGNYKDLVWAVIMTAAENSLSWREQEILRGILALRPFEQLAVEFGISPERIRQIFRRALRRVVRFRYTITDELAAKEEEIKRLILENERLNGEVFRLQHPELKDVENVDNALYRFGEPFTKRIEDCYFSVRLYNCLRMNQIETVGDIVSFKRIEYTRIRNFGRKTLDELDTFLETNNLSYAMWTNPDRPTML